MPDAKKSRGPDDVLFRTKKKETLLHTGQSLFSIEGFDGFAGDRVFKYIPEFALTRSWESRFRIPFVIKLT